MMNAIKKARRAANANQRPASRTSKGPGIKYGAATTERPTGLLPQSSNKGSASSADETKVEKIAKCQRKKKSNPAAKLGRPATSNGTKGTKGTGRRNVAPRTEQSVQLSNGGVVKLSGMRAACSGERFVSAQTKCHLVLTPYSQWHGGAGEASRSLVRGGITVVGGFSAIASAVAELKRFPMRDVSTGPGWSTNSFAFADGEVLVRDDTLKPLVAFAGSGDGLGRGGTLAGWKADVAKPLADQSLASFHIMAAFAAPLLKLSARADNFGFEIAGAPGQGKTTLLMLMASTAGQSIGPEGMTYWLTCNTTMNALEETMAEYSDMPLILDEAGLVEGSAKTAARAAALHGLAFRLANGRVKHRYGEKRGRAHRLVFFLSTNRPVASLLGAAHGAEANAIADRLITVPLLADRAYGIFDELPSEYKTSGAFADDLKRAASQHYGHALPAFIRYLVARRGKAPKKLNEQIANLVQKFIAASGADANDGSQRRVAEAFGIVYAAGRLAKKSRVLPKVYRPMRAALACYRLHCEHGRTAQSFDDRLRALMRDAGTIDNSVTPIAGMADADAAACRAILYVGRSGSRELLIPVVHRASVFANWNEIRDHLDVKQRLLTSKARDTVKRPVGPRGAKVAVYSFDISDLTD